MSADAGARNASDTSKYKYYAFISYKHEDSAWAHWLQHHLEWYRLPNRLIKDTELPRRITPVCRDTTDLTAGDNVINLLRAKLAESRYLIVICSRHMQNRPEFINEEIRSFLSLGNGIGKVIPFIVDGEAVADDPLKECLPPALLELGEERPLGITVSGRRREALLKLVAALLGLDMQAVKNHDTAYRQKRTLILLSAGMFASLALGAFMAWQTLIVKQAQLNEQLTNADSLYKQGNRVAAHDRSVTALSETNLFMDSTISDKATELARFSAVQPMFAPTVQLELYQAESDAFFTRDGQNVIISNASSVRMYDLQGRLAWTFSPMDLGQKIIAVSSDGVHCVLLNTYTPADQTSSLWLCDMVSHTRMVKLAESKRFDTYNLMDGNFENVLSAQFSPDGTLVSAYCTGGYFNENSDLAIWDATTGQKVVSLSADLLGSQAKGTQGKVVESFDFTSNRSFHWEGTVAHVFYTLGDAEPLVVPFSTLADSDAVPVKLNENRYALTRDAQDNYFFADLATNSRLPIEHAADEFFYLGNYTLINGRYAMLPIWHVLNEDTDLRGVARVLVVDMSTMQPCALTEELNNASHNALDIRFHGVRDTDRVYVTLEGKGIKALGKYRSENEQTLLQIDLSDQSVRKVQITGKKGLYSQDFVAEPLAEGDLLLLDRADGQVDALVIHDSDVQESRINEPYTQFVDNLDLSKANPKVMLNLHNDAYFLYTLVDPGATLEPGDAAPASTDGENRITAASANGVYTAQTSGQQLSVWRDATLLFQTGLSGSARSLFVTSDGQYVLAVGKDFLELFQNDGALVASLTGEACPFILDAKLSQDGKRCVVLGMLQTSFQVNLILYDATTFKPIATLSSSMNTDEKSISDVFDISPDNRYAAGLVQEWMEGQYTVAVELWSLSDGQRIAATHFPLVADAGIRLLPVDATAKPALSFAYVRFSPDCRLYAGLWSDVWIWDTDTYRMLSSLSEAGTYTSIPLLLEDGRMVFNGNGVHVWDPARKTLLWDLSVPDADGLLLSANQRYLCVYSNSGAQIYRTSDWQSVCTLATHSIDVLSFGESKIVYQANGNLHQINLEED